MPAQLTRTRPLVYSVHFCFPRFFRQCSASRVAPAGRGGGERPSEFPASFAQRRMWLLERLEPGSTAYSMPRVWRISGPLDAAALVRRHETLCTRLEERGAGGAGGSPRPRRSGWR